MTIEEYTEEVFKEVKKEIEKIDQTDHVVMTKSQYDQLTTEEKNNGSIYFIPDEESSSTSGLTRAEVQTMIDTAIGAALVTSY